jgi:hypothetical protein
MYLITRTRKRPWSMSLLTLRSEKAWDLKTPYNSLSFKFNRFQPAIAIGVYNSVMR